MQRCKYDRSIGPRLLPLNVRLRTWINLGTCKEREEKKKKKKKLRHDLMALSPHYGTGQKVPTCSAAWPLFVTWIL